MLGAQLEGEEWTCWELKGNRRLRRRTRRKDAKSQGLIILGSASTLNSARVGSYASDALPRDGVRVWREFMKYLKDGAMVMDDPA